MLVLLLALLSAGCLSPVMGHPPPQVQPSTTSRATPARPDDSSEVPGHQSTTTSQPPGLTPSPNLQTGSSPRTTLTDSSSADQNPSPPRLIESPSRTFPRTERRFHSDTNSSQCNGTLETTPGSGVRCVHNTTIQVPNNKIPQPDLRIQSRTYKNGEPRDYRLNLNTPSPTVPLDQVSSSLPVLPRAPNTPLAESRETGPLRKHSAPQGGGNFLDYHEVEDPHFDGPEVLEPHGPTAPTPRHTIQDGSGGSGGPSSQGYNWLASGAPPRGAQVNQQPGDDATGTSRPPSGGGGVGGGGVGSATTGNELLLIEWRWTELGIFFAFAVFVVSTGIIRAAFHRSHFLLTHVPESCLMITLGVIVGGILYAFGVDAMIESTENHAQIVNGQQATPKPGSAGTPAMGLPLLTPRLFFNVLIPPIILECAYSLYDRAFVDNIYPIILHAVVGKFLNLVSICAGVLLVDRNGLMGSLQRYGAPVTSNYTLSVPDALLYASVASGIDASATLPILEENGVHKDIFFVILGESLLNDAFTVTLTEFAAKLSAQRTFDRMEYVRIFLYLVVLSVGGVLMGVFGGLASALVTRCTQHCTAVEPLALFGMGYITFIMAELIQFSGHLSILVCGMIQAHYSFRNISQTSYTTLKDVTKMLAATSEAITHLFLGMVLVSNKHAWHSGFVAWTLLICCFSRLVVCVLLSTLQGLMGGRQVPLGDQLILAYCGLRGAVCFCLIHLADPVNVAPRQLFITAILALIIFTAFFQGATLKYVMELLDVNITSWGHGYHKAVEQEVHDQMLEMIRSGVEEIAGSPHNNPIAEKLHEWDEKYLKRFFVNVEEESEQTRLFNEISYAHNLTLMQHQLHLAINDTHYSKKNSKIMGAMPTIFSQLVRKVGPHVLPIIMLGDMAGRERKRLASKSHGSGSSRPRAVTPVEQSSSSSSESEPEESKEPPRVADLPPERVSTRPPTVEEVTEEEEEEEEDTSRHKMGETFTITQSSRADSPPPMVNRSHEEEQKPHPPAKGDSALDKFSHAFHKVANIARNVVVKDKNKLFVKQATPKTEASVHVEMPEVENLEFKDLEVSDRPAVPENHGENKEPNKYDPPQWPTIVPTAVEYSDSTLRSVAKLGEESLQTQDILQLVNVRNSSAVTQQKQEHQEAPKLHEEPKPKPQEKTNLQPPPVVITVTPSSDGIKDAHIRSLNMRNAQQHKPPAPPPPSLNPLERTPVVSLFRPERQVEEHAPAAPSRQDTAEPEILKHLKDTESQTTFRVSQGSAKKETLSAKSLRRAVLDTPYSRLRYRGRHSELQADYERLMQAVLSRHLRMIDDELQLVADMFVHYRGVLNHMQADSTYEGLPSELINLAMTTRENWRQTMARMSSEPPVSEVVQQIGPPQPDPQEAPRRRPAARTAPPEEAPSLPARTPRDSAQQPKPPQPPPRSNPRPS